MATSTEPKLTLSVDEMIAADLRNLGDKYSKIVFAQRRGGLPPGQGQTDSFFDAASKRANELADFLEQSDE